LISDSSSVVALSYQIFESIEGKAILHIIDVYLELLAADSKVVFSKLVGDIPTKGSILSSLLDQCMEEAQTEYQLFEVFRMKRCLVKFLVAYRITEEGN